MTYKISSCLGIAFALMSLTGCETLDMQGSSHSSGASSEGGERLAPKQPLTLIEPDGTISIGNPDGSIEVLAAPGSKEDLDVGSETESSQRSNADIIDTYGNSLDLGNNKDDDFEALPPVSPQDNGCSGMFCP